MYQVMGKKYLDPLVEFSGVLPLTVPTSYDVADIDQYLDLVDGVFLSGATTNIDPALYGQEWLTPGLTQDRDRDNFNIALIRRTIERGLPFFGICRGFQEMNVAFGGDLYQAVHDADGMMDHREKDSNAPLDEQYSANHSVKTVPDSWFNTVLGEDEFMVNSLHGQGIKTLGRSLAPLVLAADGLVEAGYCADAPQFTLGVQWHPEWKTASNPISVKIFKAFGEACRAYVAQK